VEHVVDQTTHKRNADIRTTAVIFATSKVIWLLCVKVRIIKYDNRSHNKFLTENSADSSNENIHDDAITYNLSDTFFNMIENNFQNKVKPYIINLSIENKDLKFEIDTGAVHSVILKQLYDISFNNVTLLPNDISLRDYAGNDISPTGKIIVNAKYLKKSFKMCIYVIKNGGPLLIGRNDLKIINYSPIYNTVNVDENLENILKNFEHLFKDEIGTFNKYQISLNIKKGAIPKFFKPRSIPLVLKSKVESEIDRLIDNNILTPMNYSE
jgi:hypothetical protein